MMASCDASINWACRRKSSSVRLRSVISRTTHMTCGPSLVSSGLNVISTGNSLPSARRAHRSKPDPMGRMAGLAW